MRVQTITQAGDKVKDLIKKLQYFDEDIATESVIESLNKHLL